MNLYNEENSMYENHIYWKKGFIIIGSMIEHQSEKLLNVRRKVKVLILAK